MTLAMTLAIAHGKVRHARSRPARNAFAYDAFCLRLPLSQLDALEAAGIAHNRRGVVAFDDVDHGPRDGSDLLRWIRALLADERIAADGEVVLHAFPRMLGYVFNPVSFWVCHDRMGAVRAVLCEVSNTFGEHHRYLLANPDGRALVSGETLTARKAFHVSPFCAVQGHYRFRFHFGASSWLARVDYHDDAESDAPLLATSFAGHVVPIEARSALFLLWRYRWFTAGVIARIHWQAAKLWAKGVPVFTKPAPPSVPLTR
jgi:DUF1365 family protein